MTGGGNIDQEAIKESLEGIEHAEQQLQDVEDFDAKLAAQKAADEAAQKEREEKKKRENKAAPHLTNLVEDQQLTQKTYHPMKDCKLPLFCIILTLWYFIVPIRVGRSDDEPQPQIQLGALSVSSNHCQFNLLDNGLIELELTSKEAF